MGRGKAKGSDYERWFCTELSFWWSGGKRDDIFWRSSSSGGRATVREKRHRKTSQQYGDVAAIDPSGYLLTDLVTIELKRGYSTNTILDVFDKIKQNSVHLWEDFFSQAIKSHEDAGSFAWMLVTKRDRREAMIWMPDYLFHNLHELGAFNPLPSPRVDFHAIIRPDWGDRRTICVWGTTLQAFFRSTMREHFKKLSLIA